LSYIFNYFSDLADDFDIVICFKGEGDN